jgi:hypothetical protein
MNTRTSDIGSAVLPDMLQALERSLEGVDRLTAGVAPTWAHRGGQHLAVDVIEEYASQLERVGENRGEPQAPGRPCLRSGGRRSDATRPT